MIFYQHFPYFLKKKSLKNPQISTVIKVVLSVKLHFLLSNLLKVCDKLCCRFYAIKEVGTLCWFQLIVFQKKLIYPLVIVEQKEFLNFRYSFFT